MDKNKGLAGADDPMLSRQTVDQELPNLHDDQFGSRTHGSRNVFMGLVVTTGRISAKTGRLALLPARVLARSPLVEPLRGRTERLAETGRNAEVDARRRLESAAEGVLSAPEAEHVVDGVLAGALPEAVARSLIEHRVVERLVAEVLTTVELDREMVSAREAERTERLVSQALANPALERVLAEALESRLTLDLTDQVVRSPAFKRALTEVLGSPELRAALKGQSMSFAGELVTGLGQRLRKLDDAIERGPRRWFHRAPRSQVEAGGSVRVPYAGIATRGVALAVDAALVTHDFPYRYRRDRARRLARLESPPGLGRGDGDRRRRVPRRSRLLHRILVDCRPDAGDAAAAPPRRRLVAVPHQASDVRSCACSGSSWRFFSSSPASCRYSSMIGGAPCRTSSQAPWSSTTTMLAPTRSRSSWPRMAPIAQAPSRSSSRSGDHRTPSP